MAIGNPSEGTSHRARQGVFSHRCLRKASAADPVIPGSEGSAGIAVQRTTDFHDEITDARLPEAADVVHDAAALAAIIARLLSRILGALNAPFGPIVATRGEAGASAAAGGSDALSGSSVGLTMAVASASVTPRRLASSVTDRGGACPSARSVARRTTRST